MVRVKLYYPCDSIVIELLANHHVQLQAQVIANSGHDDMIVRAPLLSRAL